MNLENLESQEALSPVLQGIKDMDLKYSEEEFSKVTGSESNSIDTSIYEFLVIAKKLIDGQKLANNPFDEMLEILRRESMKDHPKFELFKDTVRELVKNSVKTKNSEKDEEVWESNI